MNISAVLQLDAGIGPIEIQGTVSNASNQTCGKTKKNTDWQRQWFLLHQGEDSIAVTLWNCPVVQNDQVVKISGKTELNDKDKICLSATKLGQRKEDKGQQPASSQSQSTKKDVDWDAKELREHRGYALHDACLVLVALAEVNQAATGLSPQLALEMAETFVKYRYNGLSFEDKNSPVDTPQGGDPNPNYVGDDPPPVGDDDIPF